MSSHARLLSLGCTLLDSFILCALTHVTITLVALISHPAYLIAKGPDAGTLKLTHLSALHFRNSKGKVTFVTDLPASNLLLFTDFPACYPLDDIDRLTVVCI